MRRTCVIRLNQQQQELVDDAVARTGLGSPAEVLRHALRDVHADLGRHDAEGSR